MQCDEASEFFRIRSFEVDAEGCLLVVHDGRLRFWVLIFAIDQYRVVRFCAQTVVVPTLGAEVSRQVVIVSAEIHRPANAGGVKDEAAQIQMAVVRLIVAALDRK